MAVVEKDKELVGWVCGHPWRAKHNSAKKKKKKITAAMRTQQQTTSQGLESHWVYEVGYFLQDRWSRLTCLTEMLLVHFFFSNTLSHHEMLLRPKRWAFNFKKLFMDQGPIISTTLFRSAASRPFSLRQPIDPLVTPLRPKNCGWQSNLMLLCRAIRLHPLFDVFEVLQFLFGQHVKH